MLLCVSVNHQGERVTHLLLDRGRDSKKGTKGKERESRIIVSPSLFYLFIFYHIVTLL